SRGDPDRARELAGSGAAFSEDSAVLEQGVVGHDPVIAGIRDPDAAIRRDRDAARTVEVAGRRAGHALDREGLDAAGAGVGDIQAVAEDRGAADLLEAVPPAAAPAPAPEDPAVRIEHAQAGVAEVRDPHATLAVHRRSARLAQVRPRRRAGLGRGLD